jgi:hypothetical protein
LRRADTELDPGTLGAQVRRARDLVRVLTQALCSQFRRI